MRLDAGEEDSGKGRKAGRLKDLLSWAVSHTEYMQGGGGGSTSAADMPLTCCRAQAGFRASDSCLCELFQGVFAYDGHGWGWGGWRTRWAVGSP